MSSVAEVIKVSGVHVSIFFFWKTAQANLSEFFASSYTTGGGKECVSILIGWLQEAAGAGSKAWGR